MEKLNEKVEKVIKLYVNLTKLEQIQLDSKSISKLSGMLEKIEQITKVFIKDCNLGDSLWKNYKSCYDVLFSIITRKEGYKKSDYIASRFELEPQEMKRKGEIVPENKIEELLTTLIKDEEVVELFSVLYIFV